MRIRLVITNIKMLNAINILWLCTLLLVAFALQIGWRELPCPLCILQRIGVLGMAFGFLLNMQFRIHPGHYALSLLAALFTAAVAMRQLLLHIVPGAPGYGPSLFGLHLYTWVFLFSVMMIIYTVIIFSIPFQYAAVHADALKRKPYKLHWHVLFFLLMTLTVMNGISTYLMCGLDTCPENPVGYKIKV